MKSYRTARILLACVIFSLILLSFSPFGEWVVGINRLQFGPALIRLIVSFSIGTLIVVTIISICTILFGRFYCSCLCPLGIFQEGIGGIISRRPANGSNFRLVRYGIAFVTILLLITGWSIGFHALDPFSNFGALATLGVSEIPHALWSSDYPETGLSFSTILGSLPVLFLLIILIAWNKRIFCTSICPVGTILGLLSKWGIFQLRISDQCSGCGICVKKCPAGCIQPATRSIDNERCLRCLNCISICHRSAIRYSASRDKESETTTVSQERRDFLAKGTGAAIAVTGMMTGISRTAHAVIGPFTSPKSPVILPPGAGSFRRFSTICTGCQLCVANCPTKIIRPAKYRYGPVSVDMRYGDCRYNCNMCTQVCPTGALTPLTLDEKRHCQIGVAEYSARSCVAVQDWGDCGLCMNICPTGALSRKELPSGLYIPKIDRSLCIGCGTCRKICPGTVRKALNITAVTTQEQIHFALGE